MPIDPLVIRHLVEEDRNAAEQVLGRALPREFPTLEEVDGFLTVQLRRMEADPDRRDWMARLMVTRDGQIVGHCGFHGPPDVIGRAEIGYTVFQAHRGQGFAREASRALVDWAIEQGESKVYATISPNNAPSLAVVRGLGFRQVGTQIDEVDGLELVFVIEPPAP